MPAEVLGALYADRPIAERRAFGGAGSDSDVLRHGLMLPPYESSDDALHERQHDE